MSKIYMASKADILSLGNNIAPIVQSEIDAAYTTAANKGATLPAVGSRTLANLPSTMATIPGDRFEKYVSNIDIGNVSVSSISIAQYAFAYRTSITGVSIPNAQSISNSAFLGCTGIRSFYAPNVTSIGTDCFRFMYTGMTLFSLPVLESVSTAGAFKGLGAVTVHLPSVIFIGRYAFEEQNNKLVNVVAPNLAGTDGNLFNSVSSVRLIDLRGQTCATAISRFTNAIFNESTVRNYAHIWCSDAWMSWNSSTSAWEQNAYPDPDRTDPLA